MTVDPLSDPRNNLDVGDIPFLADGGYPSEAELQAIRDWPWQKGFRGLMVNYVAPRWKYGDMGYWRQRGDRFDISTGGWSGNEDIISALQQNLMFQMLCPVAWRRGGHYVFDVQNWGDDDDGDHRRLIRDPATPVDEFGFVYADEPRNTVTVTSHAERWWGPEWLPRWLKPKVRATVTINWATMEFSLRLEDA